MEPALSRRWPIRLCPRHAALERQKHRECRAKEGQQQGHRGQLARRRVGYADVDVTMRAVLAVVMFVTGRDNGRVVMMLDQ